MIRAGSLQHLSVGLTPRAKIAARNSIGYLKHTNDSS